MPIDQKAVADYAAELADAAGIAADQRPAFLSNEKVLATARKRFEDIERERGRVTAEQAARQKDYEENLKIANHNKQVVEEAQKQVQAYVARYGELPGGGDPANPAARNAAVADVIDRKTFDESIANTQNMAVELSKIAVTIGLDYYKRFGEVLDMDALQKVAVDNKLNAKQAYEVFIAPKVQELANKDVEARIAAAREEGLREGASKRAASSIAGGEPQNGFMANFGKKADERPAPATVSQSFAEAWVSSQKTAQ